MAGGMSLINGYSLLALGLMDSQSRDSPVIIYFLLELVGQPSHLWFSLISIFFFFKNENLGCLTSLQSLLTSMEDKFLLMSYLDQITYCIIVIYFHLSKSICH